MSGFRVLVADDEPLARQMVAAMLRADPDVAEIVECADGGEVTRALAEQAPDIAFLDVEMPEVDGMAIAARIAEGSPAVVFVTAFSEYAAQAFEVRAVDYVVKPFSDSRFREALSRAKEWASERHERRPPPAGAEPVHLNHLAVRDAGRLMLIPIAEVIWIEAQDYYVRVHARRGRYMLRATLASLAERLDPAHFVRVHRAALANLHEIRDVEDRQGLSLTLSDGATIAVSRTRRRDIETALAALPHQRTK